MEISNNNLNGRLVTPPHIDGGIRKTFPVSILNFTSTPPKNFKGDRKYLVIGFDTEYQRTEVNEDGDNFDNERNGDV